MATFRRDRFTWLAYLLLAYFAYMQASLGPLMPFVRSELGLSYTLGGLHLSAFAAGMIAAGMSAASLATRFGRRVIFWGGAAGMALGALILMIGQHPLATIGGALVMGALGTLLLVMIQATLSDHHGALRATALTESNILAMLCAGLSPLMVGLFQRTALGWRGALLAGIAAGVIIALLNRHVTIPSRLHDPGQQRTGRLPLPFWAFWIVLILSVAMEWSLVGWSADFLHSVVGLDAADAAVLVSVFFLGAVLGRAANSRWTLNTPVQKLLLTMLAVVAVGFPIFWLAPQPAIAVVGLGITGFGVGSLFPLGLSMALAIAADQADAASGWVSLGSGLAILVAPFTLGWLADRLDLGSAFAIVALLNWTAIAIVLVFSRFGRK